MKTQQPILTTSILAAEDLPEQTFVGFDGKVCKAGEKALGVVNADTAADNMTPADVLGVILVIAGAAITAGSEVESDGSGHAVPKTTGVGNGVAWDEAAAGDVIRIVRGI